MGRPNAKGLGIAWRRGLHLLVSDYREEFTDASIVKALSLVEEAFRAKAIELTRSEEKVPWGIALTRVLTECMHMWNLLRDASCRSQMKPSITQTEGTDGGQSSRQPRGQRQPGPKNPGNNGDTGPVSGKPNKGSGMGRGAKTVRILFV